MRIQREHWRRQLGGLDPDRLVFIDESSAKTNLTRLRGRALRGQRVKAHAPYGRWQTTTMLCGLRLRGAIAPMILSGAIDSASFTEYVRQVLAPALQPGDIVVMDNLASHQAVGAHEAIAAVGAHVAFLPPYSPDFNPIEMMWSKAKQILRTAAARNFEELCTGMAKAIAAISPSDALGYFTHCGVATEKRKTL
ncbi:MAG: IS630 family transposase [Planctomycetia bacterium]|nr:IS630 family transposase [Planctomycetia bacterium]MBE7506386.1 IS630 family transposase [Planctomycetia bacterium]MBE7506880.1 IS630 family transposase [Planctomycetia bacterium]MBE7508411.1 IS630 family transposase [Planctomycetia bacterium]MCC7314549.1 IS630 family transposase [Planctomycetota bacterium]